MQLQLKLWLKEAQILYPAAFLNCLISFNVCICVCVCVCVTTQGHTICKQIILLLLFQFRCFFFPLSKCHPSLPEKLPVFSQLSGMLAKQKDIKSAHGSQLHFYTIIMNNLKIKLTKQFHIQQHRKELIT